MSQMTIKPNTDGFNCFITPNIDISSWRL